MKEQYKGFKFGNSKLHTITFYSVLCLFTVLRNAPKAKFLHCLEYFYQTSSKYNIFGRGFYANRFVLDNNLHGVMVFSMKKRTIGSCAIKIEFGNIESSIFNVVKLMPISRLHSNTTWKVDEGHLGKSNPLWDALIAELPGIKHIWIRCSLVIFENTQSRLSFSWNMAHFRIIKT